MLYLNKLYVFLFFIIFSAVSVAQKPVEDTSRYKTVIARQSIQQKSKLYKWLWGRNRRVEWATPVRVPVLRLDTLYGGTKAYEKGGGNESKSLHLRTAAGKEYALHSINKSRDDVVPPDFKNTFVDDIIQDNISLSHPYGAFALPVMEEHAGIYHPVPRLVYLPKQPALDSFSDRYGDNLYLLEQRPDGNWSEADNLGNFKNFSGTDKVVEKLTEDNKNTADQHAFIKARLFDMLVGDWDRHEGNWRWGRTNKDGKAIYTPIPRDRDQVFFTHNGVLLDLSLYIGRYYYMRDFRHEAKGIKYLNMEEGDLDRFFTNELELEDWLNAAKDLQQSLTDAVIEASVQQLPPGVFAVSGHELIEKLKSRRQQLVDLARDYYLFVAKEVEVVGSSEREYFDVKREESGETIVSVYRLNKMSEKEDTAYYQRTFKPNETKEIRIYGIDGKDVYFVSGSSSAITIRIIGGPAKDSVIQSGNNRLHIYDDRNNIFQTPAARLHLSSGKKIHEYKYESYQYNLSGFSPLHYIGVNYWFTKYKWRKELPVRHTVGVNYSIPQHAFSASYAALYPRVAGKWDLSFKANWDAVRYTNFYGHGNKTLTNLKTGEYYRMRSSEWFILSGLRRAVGKNAIDIAVFYQRIKILNDSDRYVAKEFKGTDPNVFLANGYAGLRLAYAHVAVNDSVVPTKGFAFFANGGFANNFARKDFFQNYSAKVQAWIPLSNKFSLSVKAGGATIVGRTSAISDNAQPYEHAMIGGSESLRGYRAQRFWGKTSFYNSNEIRFITNMRTYLLNATLGFLAFFDDGRVWVPGENSNLLHTSYGGGILLAPFHQMCFSITYGISTEERLFQFGVSSLF